jgi:hypothetical protein
MSAMLNGAVLHSERNSHTEVLDNAPLEVSPLVKGNRKLRRGALLQLEEWLELFRGDVQNTLGTMLADLELVVERVPDEETRSDGDDFGQLVLLDCKHDSKY